MNREIKFRVWHKEASYMEMDVGIAPSYATASYKSKRPIGVHVIKVDDPSYILMQYTGLKDKNGIDVYEGDIIESTILGVKFKGAVFWETMAWRVKDDDLDITLGDDKARTRKVVGNIYENPELLK